MPHLSASAARPLGFAFLLAALLLLPRAAPAADASLLGFLDNHCVSCHDSTTRKGGLDLQKLSADFKNPAAFDVWVKVHDRIQAGEMPPKTRKRPDKDEAAAILTKLTASLTEADRSRRTAEGRATFRRLNRTEYENTLRDLFALPGLKVKELLPEDGKAFGFDKSATGLDLSHVQLAKYLEAADAVLDAAIAPHAVRPPTVKAHIPGTFNAMVNSAFNGQTVFLKQFKYDDTLAPIPRGRIGKEDDSKKIKRDLLKNPYQGTIGVFRADDAEFKPHFPFYPILSGKYRLRMSCWSFFWDKGTVKPSPRPEVGAIVASGRTLGYFDAPSLKPTVTEVEVWLEAGERFHFNAASLWPTFSGGNVAEYVKPGIAIDWIDIEGPLLDQWPPVGHRRLFGDLALVPVPAGAKRQNPKRKNNELDRDVHLPIRPAENLFQLAYRQHGKPFITNLGSIPQTVKFSTVSSETPEVDARRLLADFLPRAFRRPVTPDEVA